MTFGWKSRHEVSFILALCSRSLLLSRRFLFMPEVWIYAGPVNAVMFLHPERNVFFTRDLIKWRRDLEQIYSSVSINLSPAQKSKNEQHHSKVFPPSNFNADRAMMLDIVVNTVALLSEVLKSSNPCYQMLFMPTYGLSLSGVSELKKWFSMENKVWLKWVRFMDKVKIPTLYFIAVIYEILIDNTSFIKSLLMNSKSIN